MSNEQQRSHTTKMQADRDFTLLLQRMVICLSLISFFIMVCEGGKLSESESLFNFISAVDPQNVLNISWIGSEQNPCLLQLNGIIRCSKTGTNIIQIRLENLNLSGKIDADSLCRLQKLRVLNLADNYIRGNIPHSILHCTKLVYLNLSSNHLSGRIPKALTKLKFLKKLDISRNYLSGIIQSEHEFKDLLTYSVISRTSEGDGARKLLNLDQTGESSPTPSPSNSASHNPKKTSNFTFLVLVSLGVILLLVTGFFAGKKAAKSATERETLKSHEKPPTKKPPIEITKDVKQQKEQHQIELAKEVKLEKGQQQELVFFVEENERFQLEDLLLATAHLQNESFYSSLYKVILKNNAHYAVKRLKNVQVSADAFDETLRQISKLDHPNILPLVGYRCTDEEKFIIYKYQSNGSLLNLLKDCIEGKRRFSWELRMSIARGIARGLGFIYKKMEGQEVIPHGNLKLSNILLNENNEPLISEYGFSKFIDPKKAFLFASHGYTAPEKTLTEKGDVYSFGVVLLELLTGKNVEVSGIDLPRWVRSMVREEWTGEVFDKELTESAYQWAFPSLNVALMCVSQSPENRPTMEEILEKIEEVIQEHEQQQQQQDHGVFAGCCGNESNHDPCCLLHKIIPDTWDSPGSNY